MNTAGRTMLAGAVVGLALGACSTSGSGNLVTETRTTDSFDAIDVSDGLNVSLTVDPTAQTQVSVTFDDNLIDGVRTEVRDGVLAVSSSGSFRFGGGDRIVTVVTPNLSMLEASGGSDVDGTGTLVSLTLGASGGSDVDLSGLIVDVLYVDISGGADATVHPVESVSGEASGGADLTVIGNTANVDVETSGGADLHRS